MSSASPSLPSVDPKHRKFGTYSFVLAVLAFALFTVWFGSHVRVPSPSTEAAQWVQEWLAIVGSLVVVSLMGLTGTVLGIAALFRSGDRKILGLLGAVLNLLQLVGVVSLSILIFTHKGGVIQFY
jgi:hypothetical protein